MAPAYRFLGIAAALFLGGMANCFSSMSGFADLPEGNGHHIAVISSATTETAPRQRQKEIGSSLSFPPDLSRTDAVLAETGQRNREHDPLQLAFAPADEHAPADVPTPKGQVTPPPMSHPLPFSYLPETVPGVQIILARYLSFETPDGRTVHARMFVLESNMKRVVYEKLDPEVAERRRALPQRFHAHGHEIEVPDPASFTADFDIPRHCVTTIGKGVYEVNLGALTCMVRTVVPAR